MLKLRIFALILAIAYGANIIQASQQKSQSSGTTASASESTITQLSQTINVLRQERAQLVKQRDEYRNDNFTCKTVPTFEIQEEQNKPSDLETKLLALDLLITKLMLQKELLEAKNKVDAGQNQSSTTAAPNTSSSEKK